MKFSKHALLLLLAIVGCKEKDDDSGNPTPISQTAQTFDASLKKWQSEKSARSSYAYKTGHTYEFEKKSWSTRVGVKNNSVICRAYEHKEFNGTEWKTTDEWSETGSQIGLRDIGAPARTLDDMYNECADLLNKNGSGVTVSFFEVNGLLKECYLTCDDECYKNIYLTELRFGEPGNCE